MKPGLNKVILVVFFVQVGFIVSCSVC